MKNKILTLIIPAKNENESLPMVLNSLKKFNYNIIVSLSGHDYETINSIKNYHNVKILKQSAKGYGNALLEGINACKTKYFCIFNADGSFDENDLPKMLELNYQLMQVYFLQNKSVLQIVISMKKYVILKRNIKNLKHTYLKQN